MQVGTFSWAAPEVLLGKPCTEKVDIYSYGVLLWELSAGEAPPGRNLRPLRFAPPPSNSTLPGRRAAAAFPVPVYTNQSCKLVQSMKMHAAEIGAYE